MGQSLPLPERIPIPNDTQLEQLNKMGCTVIEDDDCRPSNYVKYILPSGWKMVDGSYRTEAPIFFIIDDKQMKRASIRGKWTGTFDNHLSLYIYSGKSNDVFKPIDISYRNIPTPT